MGIRKLTGTPWHIEKFSRGEGDDRRHRSRCVNYRKRDAHCYKFSERCHGSFHCPYYMEKEVESKVEQDNEKNKDQQKPILQNKVIPVDARKYFSKNQKVNHKVFGTGTVLTVDKEYVKIHFDNIGDKTLRARECINNNLFKGLSKRKTK